MHMHIAIHVAIILFILAIYASQHFGGQAAAGAP